MQDTETPPKAKARRGNEWGKKMRRRIFVFGNKD